MIFSFVSITSISSSALSFLLTPDVACFTTSARVARFWNPDCAGGEEGSSLLFSPAGPPLPNTILDMTAPMPPIERNTPPRARQQNTTEDICNIKSKI